MTSTFRVNNIDREASGAKTACAVLTVSSYTAGGESLASLLGAMGIERAEVVVCSGAGGRTGELVAGPPQALKLYSAVGVEVAGAVNVGPVSVVIAGE
jgi:hypothetical protein